MQPILKWFRTGLKKLINSIAFVPGAIVILFLLLAFGMIAFDFSPAGKQFKSNLHWLSLKDASTARTICSTIAGGVISLAVFSFSMVMILLNQAASQMSNRILGKLIENRFQQIVLGFYIGTIVYALFLLSTIRDVDSGIYVPAMSTYLLITLTIVDIFLFIYFLHYITQTVKFETIINTIYTDTFHAVKDACMKDTKPAETCTENRGLKIGAFRSGLYQGYDKKQLLEICEKNNIEVTFLYPVGTHLITNAPFMRIETGDSKLSQELIDEIKVLVNIDRGQEISTSYYYGFKQLMEISLRALSPGINDPGTAVLALHALGDLMVYRLRHYPQTSIKDSRNVVRIHVKEKSFEEMFEEYILAVWDYGKNDRLVQHEMSLLLQQLNAISPNQLVSKFDFQVQQSIKDKA